MKDDRFRPDAAARRVIPSGLSRDLARDRLFYGASFVDVTTTEGVVTSVERVPPTIAGNRGDRVLVDDPHATLTDGEIALAREKAHSLFEDRGPLASVGRNSIPKSHRGEGVNFVD